MEMDDDSEDYLQPSQTAPWGGSTKAKIINDPLHGHFSLPSYCIEFIDTPQFQRLRDLKQLGTSYFVFPGASHNRFEHCLGVCYLAGNMLKRIRKNQQELHVSARDMMVVRLAGLCHDIGHGPFSHAFEGWLRHSHLNKDFHHEKMSQLMVEYLVEENNIDIEKEDIRLIQDLIAGTPSKSTEKLFLFDIVANSRNSIDVDKFDYLGRDCLNCGIKSSYDYSRLLKFNRVINSRICFHSKEVYNIYEMFHTRYSMHKQVYNHKVGKAIEFMISDAFTEANPYLKISDATRDVREYAKLTDTILRQIETSTDQNLKSSQEIIKNIRKRRLYKFADEALIPDDKWAQMEGLTEEKLITYGSSLQPNDIIIDFLSMNYAMKNKNPVDNTHFFSKWDSSESFTIAKENVSLLIPDKFSERYIRIFVRNPEKQQEAQVLFRKFLDSHKCKPSPAHSIPLRNSAKKVPSPESPESTRTAKKLRYSEDEF